MEIKDALVTKAVISTVPMPNAIGGAFDSTVTSALIGQNAVTAAASFPNLKTKGFEIFYNYDGKVTLAIGDLGQTPTQLVIAGVLKNGSDVIVNARIDESKSLETMIPPNLFTGKYYINNVTQFLLNKTAQVNARIDVFSFTRKQLIMRNIIQEDDPPGKVAGILNVAATTSVDHAIEARKNGII
jgi:hypothetical protein